MKMWPLADNVISSKKKRKKKREKDQTSEPEMWWKMQLIHRLCNTIFMAVCRTFTPGVYLCGKSDNIRENDNIPEH